MFWFEDSLELLLSGLEESLSDVRSDLYREHYEKLQEMALEFKSAWDCEREKFFAKLDENEG